MSSRFSRLYGWMSLEMRAVRPNRTTFSSRPPVAVSTGQSRSGQVRSPAEPDHLQLQASRGCQDRSGTGHVRHRSPAEPSHHSTNVRQSPTPGGLQWRPTVLEVSAAGHQASGQLVYGQVGRSAEQEPAGAPGPRQQVLHETGDHLSLPRAWRGGGDDTSQLTHRSPTEIWEISQVISYAGMISSLSSTALMQDWHDGMRQSASIIVASMDASHIRS